MSIITVVSEGDAEETDAPERDDMKKEKKRVENNNGHCLLSILYIPDTVPHALNVSPSFFPYKPILPPFHI